MTKRPTLRRREQPPWLVPVLASAVLSALLTATITTNVVHEAWHVVTSPFRPAQSVQQQNVAKFFSETKNAVIWAGAPAMFDASRRYFLRRYDLLDPTRTHAFRPTLHLARVEDLSASAAVLQGTFLITVGRVLTSNIVSDEPHVVDTLIQLVPYSVTAPTSKQVRSVVYCRVPLQPGARHRPGELLFAEGIVVGAGNIAFNEGGFRPGAYMACAAVAHPAGICGRGAIPPTDFSRCPPYKVTSREEEAIR